MGAQKRCELQGFFKGQQEKKEKGSQQNDTLKKMVSRFFISMASQENDNLQGATPT
jgi:hypothetical protein